MQGFVKFIKKRKFKLIIASTNSFYYIKTNKKTSKIGTETHVRAVFFFFFLDTNRWVAQEQTRQWFGKGNVKRLTESLLNGTENNIRTNYIKAKIDNTQQNSKCILWGEKDTTVNQIIMKGSTLTQKKNS